jgi:hypothetical protein
MLYQLSTGNSVGNLSTIVSNSVRKALPEKGQNEKKNHKKISILSDIKHKRYN